VLGSEAEVERACLAPVLENPSDFQHGAGIAIFDKIMQFSPRTILNKMKDWFGAGASNASFPVDDSGTVNSVLIFVILNKDTCKLSGKVINEKTLFKTSL